MMEQLFNEKNRQMVGNLTMAISSQFLSFWRKIQEPPARVQIKKINEAPPQRNLPKIPQNSNFSNYKTQSMDGSYVKKQAIIPQIPTRPPQKSQGQQEQKTDPTQIFQLFYNEVRQKLLVKYQNLSNEKIIKFAKQKWKELPKQKKLYYLAKYKKMKGQAKIDKQDGLLDIPGVKSESIEARNGDNKGSSFSNSNNNNRQTPSISQVLKSSNGSQLKQAVSQASTIQNKTVPTQSSDKQFQSKFRQIYNNLHSKTQIHQKKQP